MTDPDIMDIVTMLRSPDRLEPYLCAAAAEEIERLRKELDTRIAMCDMRSEKIIELTNERDEARREILESLHPDLRESYAAAREWDYLKENTDG